MPEAPWGTDAQAWIQAQAAQRGMSIPQVLGLDFQSEFGVPFEQFRTALNNPPGQYTGNIPTIDDQPAPFLPGPGGSTVGVPGWQPGDPLPEGFTQDATTGAITPTERISDTAPWGTDPAGWFVEMGRQFGGTGDLNEMLAQFNRPAMQTFHPAFDQALQTLYGSSLSDLTGLLPSPPPPPGTGGGPGGGSVPPPGGYPRVPGQGTFPLPPLRNNTAPVNINDLYNLSRQQYADALQERMQNAVAPIHLTPRTLESEYGPLPPLPGPPQFIPIRDFQRMSLPQEVPLPQGWTQVGRSQPAIPGLAPIAVGSPTDTTGAPTGLPTAPLSMVTTPGSPGTGGALTGNPYTPGTIQWQAWQQRYG